MGQSIFLEMLNHIFNKYEEMLANWWLRVRMWLMKYNNMKYGVLSPQKGAWIYPTGHINYTYWLCGNVSNLPFWFSTWIMTTFINVLSIHYTICNNLYFHHIIVHIFIDSNSWIEKEHQTSLRNIVTTLKIKRLTL